jgi:glucokinase
LPEQSTPSRMAPMKKLLCGVDLGGTKLSVGLVEQRGKLVDKLVAYDHTRKNEEELILQIHGLVRQLLERNRTEENDILGIGVGFAGHLRFKDGMVITSSNFPGLRIKNFPIRKAIQEQFSVPVIVDNDANAQGYAEFRFGAGVPYDTVIFLTLSTGIGAGLVLEGKLYRGMTGTAGEFGHTIVEPTSDLLCGCGNHGCLFALAAGQSLPQLVKKKLDRGMKTGLRINSLEQIDGRLIKQGLDSDDELAKTVVLECADYVGIGIYNLFQIFNPPVIVLGGGLINWGPLYLDRIRQKFYGLARDMLFDPIGIALSKLGSDAGLIGAAALLLEQT